MESRHTVCRMCHVQCGLIIDIEDGRPVATHGDRNNPVSYGYSCIKGREMARLHSLPSRLLHSVRREPNGSFARIDSAVASEEIGRRLRAIIDEHGPRSVALFIGTYGYNNFAMQGFGQALMESIGSRMIFTSVTIDQPGKGIALALHGPWLAGTPPIESWESLLLVGTNPLVSMNGGLGINPARTLKLAQARGMKLIVVDPRRTESAAKADIFLQCRPGEDPTILAGLAHLLIADGLVDKAFVEAETTGFEALRDAVAPFTPSYVAARADIDAEDLVRAARILGHSRSGAVSAGTGSNMSGHGNVTEYLVKVLTTLRGHWLRAGAEKQNPGVLIDPPPIIAASPGPFPAWGFGEQMRVRGLTDTAAGLPTAALPDEMLTEGEGRVRALLVLGANPLAAWPDQIKTKAALESLDLLVCFDPKMTATARLADYVLAPKLALEVEGNTALNEMVGCFGPGWGFERPYAQISPPVLDTPPGSDLDEEWAQLWGIARGLGVGLNVQPWSTLDPARKVALATPIDMENRPSSSDVWRAILKGAPVDYDTIREVPHGRMIERPFVTVAAKPDGWTGRLDIGSPPMMAELAEVLSEPPNAGRADDPFPFRLISRRLNDMHNSSWHDNPGQQRKYRVNPAFINPADMAALGIEAGEVVEIASERATILGLAEPAPDVRQGCVSMSHAWGGVPGEAEDPHRDGGATSRLTFNDRTYDRVTGIPQMSTIPVRIKAAPAAPA